MRYTNWLATGFLSLVSTMASAGQLTCAGRIQQINMHASDTFMLQLDSMNAPVFFCRTNQLWTVPGTGYQTSPETCKTLIAMFTAAKLADRPIGVIYFDGDAVPTACNAWGNWQSANIRYFTWGD